MSNFSSSKLTLIQDTYLTLEEIHELLGHDTEKTKLILEDKSNLKNLVRKEVLLKDQDELMAKMIERGLSPNDKAGSYFLLFASIVINSPKIIKLLISKGADVQAGVLDNPQHTEAIRTPLLRACVDSHPDIIEQLLEAGADIYPKNTPQNSSTFSQAISRQDRTLNNFSNKIFELLLQKSEYGLTPEILRPHSIGAIHTIVSYLLASQNIHCLNLILEKNRKNNFDLRYEVLNILHRQTEKYLHNHSHHLISFHFKESVEKELSICLEKKELERLLPQTNLHSNSPKATHKI